MSGSPSLTHSNRELVMINLKTCWIFCVANNNSIHTRTDNTQYNHREDDTNNESDPKRNSSKIQSKRIRKKCSKSPCDESIADTNHYQYTIHDVVRDDCSPTTLFEKSYNILCCVNKTVAIES